jgi:hypothetical protein
MDKKNLQDEQDYMREIAAAWEPEPMSALGVFAMTGIVTTGLVAELEEARMTVVDCGGPWGDFLIDIHRVADLQDYAAAREGK